MNNHFKERLSRIQDRFNQTFGMNPLIAPKIRASVIFAVIKLGLLQRRIAMAPTPESMREFERTQTLLEKVFSKVEKLSSGKKPAD